MIEDRTLLPDRKDICTQDFFFFLTFEVIPVTQAYVLLNKLCLHYRSRVENLGRAASLARFL